MNPLVVAMTGATGAIYGIRFTPGSARKSTEVHLALSAWAEKTIALETEYSVDHTVGKVLDLLEVENILFTRWGGTE